MALFDTVPLMESLPLTFENDGYVPTSEMHNKYKRSIVPGEGQIRDKEEYFCRNAHVYDVRGKKVTWGDIAPSDVAGMLGVYYILSENNASLGSLENPRFVKRNAIARIVDGKIQTSKKLIDAHYHCWKVCRN